MKKFLGVVVSVGVFALLVGAAVAQTEHGSGHDMQGAKGHAGNAGHHEMMQNHMEMMKNHMGNAGHEMKSQMKSHMGKTGHDMKSHAGKPGHE